jgi:hypothetical protein
MLTIEKTADYVQNWIAAFEAKDLDRVLAFYTGRRDLPFPAGCAAEP